MEDKRYNSPPLAVAVQLLGRCCEAAGEVTTQVLAF